MWTTTNCYEFSSVDLDKFDNIKNFLQTDVLHKINLSKILQEKTDLKFQQDLKLKFLIRIST